MIIDGEFEKLIPPLSKDEYDQLEKNCIEYGIRDEIIVAVYPDSNGEVLLDGHNRYKISMNNGGLAYKVKRIDFSSREKAMEWMILNQFGRRNLSTYDRSILALKLKPVIAERAKEKQKEAGGAVRQKSDKAEVDTKKELATIAGVSHDTIHKVEFLEKNADEATKEKLRKGEVSIHKAYQGLVLTHTSKTKAQEVKDAISSHESFKDEKKDSVINFDSVVKDKESVKTIANDILSRIRDVSSAVRKLGWEPVERIRECVNAMSEEERKQNAERVEDAIGVLEIYLEELNG